MNGKLLRLVQPTAAARSAGQPGAGHLKALLRGAERGALLDALAACGGNLASAARKLGVERSALITRLRELGVDLL